MSSNTSANQAVSFQVVREGDNIFMFVESPNSSPENLDVIDLVYQAVQGAVKQKAQIIESTKLAAVFNVPERKVSQ